MLTSHFPSARD